MNFSAVVVAAGSSTRAGPGAPKPWRSLGGRPILRWSVEALSRAGAREIIVVTAPERTADADEALAGLANWKAVPGGVTRAESVQAGLAALSTPDEEAVLVHDAARPFVTSAHVQSLLVALAEADGAVPALPVADTLKRGVDIVAETVSRNGLWRAQTPQAFRLRTLRQAYGAWPADAEPTDDAAVVERAGGKVALVPGDPLLMKLTYPEDFAMAEQLAGGRRIVRTGFGVDAHRWGPGEAVWLCGVKIDHDQTLVGHSDADAGLHALTDAILGAIGEGDIGEHFPPTDPQWKGASSDRFLVHAAKLVAAKGGSLLNVDVTLICERPKIRPHRDAMRARLAELLALPLDRVSVKATTTEGMGFTGRGEGLMAQAVATVETPA
ncbi:MAG: bifunctional 2-C-methyl-D-erythritol 4-phosphate cytidylyltransferase/2-C-methyl-D-erythritol 2,4-cyclodiphosphate synthase [Phenylobacterium sp.]|uniref:bifunctional 2-C-methyl-D-erythritol 4-phosphate cytidylyltransferase/2-C-methyl-D-erythritol 2,4-cyclodiphosphate synthase n=1 Tax=Phenylobacterium sp. TaxID=1871053 RepID=UPI002724F3C0|nr:bifunctional 2-C-methyl-D-erythritol 4-phosphate cytidylyltransferase/2-C-methyl-D-erythritol 2,4-cyclodiphosphate synthase [Phenylobacterium sp.]MDO9245334.1 bifunctional 2-C-methyl-D-erythritol 4-phosphate cytidylyltransferase/2-C-methyl-D-erythritol 2,4-cyclodiphosphate synthase [Phenylobacterium sp.]MDP2009669.1 bifunctional 2-C-methyl-D-erythritol 4-phosphate cytidylyltransferase/2-C-methyl-D-erythritol 2,4-cyclodiphosphate synthase [Phenylobacterium sp.]MDP3633073.1 bifunctional 2-C-met